MNEPPRSLNALKSIDLAAEDDFSLGGLSICPSLREVRTGGRREMIEPRVMQVLVALARMDGAAVSRDQLIERCWGGRLVGDDAINSCVAKVRALAALVAPPAFEIETIPRVGYRLHTRSATERKTSAAAPSFSAMETSVRSGLPGLALWRWIVIAGASLAILIGVLAWHFLQAGNSLDWEVVESRQPFIGTSLIERYPALSPDGTILAYSAGPNLTSRQIYLRLIKGDSSIQLTHEAYDATSPAWSPDGTTIAYSVFQSGQPCRIMEMEIPSGVPHRVGKCHRAERTELAFDPSGHALVFADSPATGMPVRLVQLDVESGRVLPLTDPPRSSLGDEGGFSFSPGGRYLAYVRDIGDIHNEIRLRNLKDGSEHLVEDVHDCDGSVGWTPDGAAILVARSCLGNYSLWSYSPEGGKSRQIMASASYIGRLSVNSNGYVAMETNGGHAPVVSFKPNSGQPPIPLDESSGLTTSCADFAPDGTLAVTGHMGSAFGVWIASHEGAPFRKLMSLPRFACAIRWSPDGTRFAFIETGRGGFDLPVVGRDGEIVMRIDLGATEPNLFDWTADGKSILTSRLEKQGWRIWRSDLSMPSKSVPITPLGWMDPRVHGSMLFAEKSGAVGTWRLDGGAPQRVADGPTPESSDLFTISGDQLYFADMTDPAHPAIAAQSVFGGSKRRLMPLPFGTVNFTFAVNPKSGDIAFSPPASDDSDIGLVRLQRR